MALQITTRLNDALWSLRREFGMETDIDRICRATRFKQALTPEQVDDLFISYPKRVPEDFKSALIARIQEIVRLYWAYRDGRKVFHKLRKGILFLENVARFRFVGCRLVEDDVLGFQLEIRPELLEK